MSLAVRHLNETNNRQIHRTWGCVSI